MPKFTAIFLTLLVLSRAVAQPSAPSQSQASTNTPQPPPTLEALTNTIANSKGRAVYDSFTTIAEEAKTPEQQAQAFNAVFPYLVSEKVIVVRDDVPPSYHFPDKFFTYAEMAGNTIRKLGAPGRRGLVNGLALSDEASAEHCALLLCDIQESALAVKGDPQQKEFLELEPGDRHALELFLQQHGSSLPLSVLNSFHRAGFPAADGYILTVLRTSKDVWKQIDSVTYLHLYGYEPALNDLLEIFKTNTVLRPTVRDGFPYFTNSDRVSKAITEIMNGTKDKALKQECQNALDLVRLKADWRRQFSPKTTNAPPVNPSR